MRNNLAEAKQLLTMSQSEKYKLEKELNNMAVHYENAIKDKKIYED